MSDLASLQQQRFERWRQTPDTKVNDPQEAAAFIRTLGLITAFPASPEIPNVYNAHVGDPEKKTEAEWDTPTGTVYTWRWELGRMDAAFYGVIVRKRPTFVAWDLLPSVLRLWGEPRTPDELFDLGKLSSNAYRIAQVLEKAGGTLTTGDLRQAAGFPTGREHRAAYLKAIDELDARLFLAKVFDGNRAEGEEMGHAFVPMRYRRYVDTAERMTREEALERFLTSYLSSAVYALPTVLARHLRLLETELRAGLERQVEAGNAGRAVLPGQKGHSYIWVKD